MDEAGFRLLFSVEADGNTSISKFKSNETGITVFIADVDGPLVNGYFCLGMPLTQKHRFIKINYLVSSCIVFSTY